MAKHSARHDGPVVELRGDVARDITANDSITPEMGEAAA